MEGIKHIPSNQYVQCQVYPSWLIKACNLLNQEQGTTQPRKGTTHTVSGRISLTGPFQSDAGQIHVKNEASLKKALKFFTSFPPSCLCTDIPNSWWMDPLFGDDTCEVIPTQRHTDMNSFLLPEYPGSPFSLLDPRMPFQFCIMYLFVSDPPAL